MAAVIPKDCWPARQQRPANYTALSGLLMLAYRDLHYNRVAARDGAGAFPQRD